MSIWHKNAIAGLWRNSLGRSMSYRLTHLLIPHLVWNQEIYGGVLDQYVNNATLLLDAGCGHRLLGGGLDHIERAVMSKPRSSVGVDLDLGALQNHKTLRLRVCSSLDRLPFAAEMFDLVACNMVVEHLPSPSTAFRELGRVLRSNGVLLVHTPNALNYAVLAGRILKGLLPRRVILTIVRWSDSRNGQDVFPTFYRANTRHRLRRLLGETGLREEVCRMLVGPQPACSFFVPIAFIELLIMRATMFPLLRPFATTILGVYRKLPGRQGPETRERLGPASVAD